MNEMKLIVKGLVMTIIAYTTALIMLFVYTDTNRIVRTVCIGVCIIGHLVYMSGQTEKVFELWRKKFGE